MQQIIYYRICIYMSEYLVYINSINVEGMHLHSFLTSIALLF